MEGPELLHFNSNVVNNSFRPLDLFRAFEVFNRHQRSGVVKEVLPQSLQVFTEKRDRKT